MNEKDKEIAAIVTAVANGAEWECQVKGQKGDAWFNEPDPSLKNLFFWMIQDSASVRLVPAKQKRIKLARELPSQFWVTKDKWDFRDVFSIMGETLKVDGLERYDVERLHDLGYCYTIGRINLSSFETDEPLDEKPS